MQRRRVFGISLIVLGLAILFAEPFKITGAIIGFEAIGDVWVYAIGAALIVSGIILESARREEYTFSTLEDIVEVVNVAEDKHIILDSSFVIDAEKGNIDMNELIKEWGDNIIVPGEIYKELSKNKKVSERLRPYVRDLTGEEFGKYKNISRKVLEQGNKHQTAIELLPYLENPELLNKKNRREQAAIGEKIKKASRNVLKDMRKRGIDPFELRKYTNPRTYLNATAEYLKSHWLVSKGDIDVLSYAIYDSRHNIKTDILSSDTDFRDALSLLKGRKSKQNVAKNMRYLDFREYASAA